MKTRVLAVGGTGTYPGIDNYDIWSAPSFSDYNAVIIDPIQTSLKWVRVTHPASDGNYRTDANRDAGIGKAMITTMDARNIEILNLLNIIQGVIICFLREEESVVTIHNPEIGTPIRRLGIYSWLPQIKFQRPNDTTRSYQFPGILNIRARKGSSIGNIDQKSIFSRYFSTFKGSISFEALYETPSDFRYFDKIIARNKANEVISAMIPVGKGSLVFIPPNNANDKKKEGGVLLSCIKDLIGMSSEVPPPAWSSKFSLPGETKHNDEISKLDEHLLEIKHKKDALESEQNEFLKYKGLLYEQGRELEKAVRSAFRLIGFNVMEPDDYVEEYDLYIQEEELALVGEIEGTDDSQIDRDKYRQLFEYVECEIDKGRDVKGILIGNAFRLKDPVERPGAFSEAATKGCDGQHYCRITTYKLFDLVSVILENPTAKDKIMKQILDCEGEFS